MPDITLGNLLVLAGMLDGLFAALLGVAAARNQGSGPGTPQYARERTHRRNAVLLFGSALVLILVGVVTWDVVLIAGAG